MKAPKYLILLVTLSVSSVVLGMSNNDDDKVIIQTNDGKELVIPSEIAEFSDTIQKLIEDVGTSNPIPLTSASSADWQAIEPLLKLFPYKEVSYKGLDSWRINALKNIRSKAGVTNWMKLYDESFNAHNELGVRLDKLNSQVLINIINASVYLGIPIIYNTAASIVANRNIKNRFSTKEIQQISERSVRNRILFRISQQMGIIKELDKSLIEFEKAFWAMSSDQAKQVWTELEKLRKKEIDALNARSQIKQILKLK